MLVEYYTQEPPEIILIEFHAKQLGIIIKVTIQG
jgi:hypothetical protein